MNPLTGIIPKLTTEKQKNRNSLRRTDAIRCRSEGSPYILALERHIYFAVRIASFPNV
jgi:hypothetical protein